MRCGMIELSDKSSCTGCFACSEICSVHAIKDECDEWGFHYPRIDNELCLKCGACTRVCPVLNKESMDDILGCYAAQHEDSEVVSKSASGAVFPALAEKVLERHGVVYGCEMSLSDCKVRHIRVTDMSDVSRLQGSKYVQSDLNGVFKEVIVDLSRGVDVLFSGTPCQCAGLRKCVPVQYLSHLFLVEIVCHGVMSPQLFEAYKNDLSNRASSPIKEVLFRDKQSYPGRSSFVVRFENPTKNICVRSYTDPYGRLFQSRLALRNSCYCCPARGRDSCADLTIGDYWGVEKWHPELAEKGAISVVIVHTQKGEAAFFDARLSRWKTDYSLAKKDNPSICKDTSRNEAQYSLFVRSIRNMSFIEAVSRTLDGPRSIRLIRRIVGKARRLLKI